MQSNHHLLFSPNNSVIHADLHTAASNGNTDLTENLLMIGANVNALNAANVTPIFLAAKYGHAETIKKLLEYGAHYKDVGLYDTSGDLITPLEIAATNGHLDAVKILLSRPQSPKYLQQTLHYCYNHALICKEEKRNRLFTFRHDKSV